MKTILLILALPLVFTRVSNVHAETTTALFQKYRCSICHADREPGAGPAYVDIASRYRGTPKADARLVALIRKGARSGGPWHMPPHPEVSRAAASQMARYILSLNSK